ncbi:MAG: dockerin type I domain-containing protein, partial [Saprospiraceae bacterium]
NPTVFLMSDGQNNTGADPEAVGNNLIAAGITIHSIPVGNGADIDLLADLASESGGVMLPAYSDDMIPAIYAELAARHQGFSLINDSIRLTEHLFFGTEFSSSAVSAALSVEEGSGPLTIFLGLKNVTDFNTRSNSILRSVDLIGPDSNLVSPNNYRVLDDPFYRILIIPNPTPGTYTLFVGNSQPIAPDVNVVSFVENPAPDLYIDAIPRVLTTPDTVTISASTTFLTTLYDPDIQYNSIVIRPDSSIVPLDLALDLFTGTVAGYFDDFNGGGTYKVQVEVSVPEGARVLPGESIFDAPSEFNPTVKPFVRVASTSFTLFRPGECPPCDGENRDCDEDRLPNEIEDAFPNQDVDGDGLPNRCDEDSDGDDIPDEQELDLDLNQNGVPDVYEVPEGFACAPDSKFELMVADTTSPACRADNGSIRVSVADAMGAVTYRWSHDTTLNNPIAQNLTAFIYAVTATDESGCRRTVTIDLREDCSNLPEQEDIVVSTNCPERVPQNCEFPVVITVDMSGSTAPDTLLGSFTGVLTWNPAVLQYVGPSSVLSGFNGFINLDSLNGRLIFNGANAAGVNGVMDIFKSRFRAIGPVNSSDSIRVEFLSFAAARTFTNLTPMLRTPLCTFTIIPAGLLGDVNNDGAVTSTDANIILSFDAGLTLPTNIEERIDNGFGDVNRDRLTNATDALIVLTYDVQLPVPYPVGESFCPGDSSINDALGLEKRSLPAIDIVITPQQIADHPESIKVPVYADCNQAGVKLGSYKAVITWDPQELELSDFFGGNTPGFELPTLNESELESGKLVIVHANPYGKAGIVPLFTLQFKQLGQRGLESLKLDFVNMAAAGSFDQLKANVQPQASVQQPTLQAASVRIFPNPFSETVQIVYELPADAPVHIEVHNVIGQKVADIIQAEQVKGTYRINWKGLADAKLQSCIYVFTVKIGDYMHSEKVLYLKR